MVRYTKFRVDRPIRSRVILGKPKGVSSTPPPLLARVNYVTPTTCNQSTTRLAACEEQMAAASCMLFSFLTGAQTLRLVSSHFPSHVIRGKSMNLSCDYDTDGKKIYKVKWYKNDSEFYSYDPGTPGRIFKIPGVKVNVSI